MRIANDNGATPTSNDYIQVLALHCQARVERTLLIRVKRFGKDIIPSENHDDWEILID